MLRSLPRLVAMVSHLLTPSPNLCLHMLNRPLADARLSRCRLDDI